MEDNEMAQNLFPLHNYDQNYIEIGYNISYYRKHKKLTQEQLAEKIGISRQHLGAIEGLTFCASYHLTYCLP